MGIKGRNLMCLENIELQVDGHARQARVPLQATWLEPPLAQVTLGDAAQRLGEEGEN